MGIIRIAKFVTKGRYDIALHNIIPAEVHVACRTGSKGHQLIAAGMYFG